MSADPGSPLVSSFIPAVYQGWGLCSLQRGPWGEPSWFTVQGRARENPLYCPWMCGYQNAVVLAQGPEELALSAGNMGTWMSRASSDLRGVA